MSEHTFTVFEVYFRHRKDGSLEIIDAPRHVNIYGEPMERRQLSIWAGLEDDRWIREGKDRSEFSCWSGRCFPVGPIDSYGLYYGQVLLHYSVTGYEEVEYDCDYYLLCARKVAKKIAKPRVLRRLQDSSCFIPVTDAFDLKEAREYTAYGSLGIVNG